MSCKNVLQECPTRISDKSVLRECLMHCKSVTLSHHQSVVRDCPKRVSHESVRQESPTKKCPKRFGGNCVCVSLCCCKAYTRERIIIRSVFICCPMSCLISICSFHLYLTFGFVGSILFFTPNSGYNWGRGHTQQTWKILERPTLSNPHTPSTEP